MKTVAIIPARGGSKRLPGKNLIELGGLPLILHSINYAKANMHYINKIIVSTDDEKIKAVSLDAGVEVIDRPADLGTDTATTVSVLKHVIEQSENKIENIILLQPTNPLRPKDLLRRTMEIFNFGKYESLMTVSRSHKKLGKIKDDSYSPYNYKMGQRSQDLEPLFYENGLLYISKAAIIKEGEILGKKNFPFIVEHLFARVDIDEQVDLDYAEFLLNREKSSFNE